MLLGSKITGVGLDIEDNRIRMATLTVGRPKYMLERFAETLIPVEVMENGRIKRAEILAEILRESWSSLRTRERRIVAAVPNQHAFVRNLTLPLMKPRDVFKAARYHFLSVLPLPLEEAVVQVSGIRPKDAGELEVTIVATRKAQVEELSTAIQLAGLKPVAVEIRSLAARRVLDIDKEPQILVDIGSQAAYLSFFKKGHLRFMRTLFLWRHWESASGLDAGVIDQRELNKNGCCNMNTHELMTEIDRSLEYWTRESGQDLNLSKLVVIGADTNVDCIPPSWEGHRSVSVERGNPWRLVESPGHISSPERLNLERCFTVAIGLAARRGRLL